MEKWSDDLIVTPAWKPRGEITKSGLPTFYTVKSVVFAITRPYKLIFAAVAVTVIVTENDFGEEMELHAGGAPEQSSLLSDLSRVFTCETCANEMRGVQ